MFSQSVVAMFNVMASGVYEVWALAKVTASDFITALGYFLQVSRLNEGVIKEPRFM
jgi:hypothetical protein